MNGFDRPNPTTVGFYVAVVAIALTGVALLMAGRDQAPAAPTPDPVVTASPTATARPSSTPTPTPTATPTPPPTPTPTEDPTEVRLQELRESDAWIGLAEWDRAGSGKEAFYWFSTRTACPYGEFSNAEAVWNSFAPALREELLTMAVQQEVTPSDSRYPGTPIEDGFTSGVLVWWTNSEGGTRGRGSMFIAEASYITADGEARIRQWPVLIGHGIEPDVSTEAYLRAIGPVQDLSVSEVPDTYEGANEQFNDHHLDWLFDQEPINPPVAPPLQCPGS